MAGSFFPLRDFFDSFLHTICSALRVSSSSSSFPEDLGLWEFFFHGKILVLNMYTRKAVEYKPLEIAVEGRFWIMYLDMTPDMILCLLPLYFRNNMR